MAAIEGTIRTIRAESGAINTAPGPDQHHIGGVLMAALESTLSARLWAKVDRCGPDECWPWTGAIANFGYGSISSTQTDRAHRVAWKLTNGPIPDGLCVLHRCDNPPCCNPAHLYLGTRTDNARDAVERGRRPRGEQISNAKLTEKQVLEIRAALAAGESGNSVGLRYGVNRKNIYAIRDRRSWKHV